VRNRELEFSLKNISKKELIDKIESTILVFDLSLQNITEEELKNESTRFTFKIFSYPLLEIYGSAVFSPIHDPLTDPKQIEPLKSVFIHIIPYNDMSNVIVGYNNDYVDNWIKDYVDSWAGLEEEDFERKLTNLFAAFIENWGMSPVLLKEIKEENLQLFKEYTFRNALNHSPDQQTDFNLFEYKE